MKPPVSRRGRILRLIGIVLLVLIVGLYLVLPVAFGVAAILPRPVAVGAPPAGFDEVALTAEDGVTLQAWYRVPANGAAIVLVHGAGNSRENVRAYAELLAGHGYGVLALDTRGHGQSGGPANLYGWQGTRDVGAALAFLQAQPDVNAIGGLGLSMGAEILLGAASTYPELRAIVAEGATRRSLAELIALETERPLVRNFTARVSFAAVQLLSGQTPPEPPLLDSMVAAEGTAFLLIAGGAVESEVAFNTLFARTVSDRAELWIAPETPHIGALARHPEEYAQRVIAFLDGTLPPVGEE